MANPSHANLRNRTLAAPFDLDADACGIREEVELLDPHPHAAHTRVGKAELDDAVGQRLHQVDVAGSGDGTMPSTMAS